MPACRTTWHAKWAKVPFAISFRVSEGQLGGLARELWQNAVAQTHAPTSARILSRTRTAVCPAGIFSSRQAGKSVGTHHSMKQMRNNDSYGNQNLGNKRQVEMQLGSGHKVSGPLEATSGYSRSRFDRKTPMEKSSGFLHKVHGPLEVFSQYSRPYQLRQYTLPRIFHHLSLHNQAYSMKSPMANHANKNPVNEKVSKFPCTPADPPTVMRESPADFSDSGNQPATLKIRKCRSEVARIQRRVNRAVNRRAIAPSIV